MEESREAIKAVREANNELEDSYELHLKSWAKTTIERSNGAIDTLEKYIENSISKEAIQEKIEELKQQYKEILGQNDIKAFILKCQIEILKELLEGK